MIGGVPGKVIDTSGDPGKSPSHSPTLLSVLVTRLEVTSHNDGGEHRQASSSFIFATHLPAQTGDYARPHGFRACVDRLPHRGLADEFLPYEATRPGPGRAGEHRAADAVEIQAQRVPAGDALLDRDELAPRVGVEADEHQASGRRWGRRLDPVDTGVAAAQQPLAAVACR